MKDKLAEILLFVILIVILLLWLGFWFSTCVPAKLDQDPSMPYICAVLGS